jgi:hypothetical protein
MMELKGVAWMQFALRVNSSGENPDNFKEHENQLAEVARRWWTIGSIYLSDSWSQNMIWSGRAE